MRYYLIDIKNPRTGLPVAGAKVTIHLAYTDTLATFYDSDSTAAPPHANPYVSATGLDKFYFPDGYYDVTASFGGTTVTDQDVEISDIIEIKMVCLDAASRAEAAAASAQTNASNAASSAGTAATSAAAAQASATAAANSAAAAAGSEGSVAANAAAAAASAANALTSENNAKTSETNARSSETNAGSSAINAGNSATTAVNNANASATSATNAANSATAAAGSATAAGNSATNAGTSASSAASSAAAAAASQAASGSYPNAAATNVPRGLTQASVGAITPGSGGTNGTFALGFTGGNFTVQPTGTFTVAGGVLTAVTITGPGLYIGAAPAVPTATFAASAGLAGAAVALTAQFLVGNGAYYWVQSADGLQLVHYQNVGGVATIDANTGPIITSGGLQTIVGGSVGGRENLWPDPFMRNYARWLLTNPGDKPYALGTGLFVEPARASSPYPDGNQLRCAGNSSTGFVTYLMNVGVAVGDTIQIGMMLARSSGAFGPGVNLMNYYFVRRDGTVASTGTLYTTTAQVPLDTTSRAFISAALAVPADAFTLGINWGNIVAGVDLLIDAIWMHKTSVPAQPTDNAVIPNGIDRVAALEAISPEVNNIALKRVTYASRTLVMQGARGDTSFSNNNGFSQALITSAIPAGGFNAVEFPLGWAASNRSPSKLFAEVRTIPAASAKHPSAGRVIARGWIGVDPTTAGGDTYVIAMHDPITGALKTVTPAMLDDRYCVGIFGIQPDGTDVGNLLMPRGDSQTNMDATYPQSYNCPPYSVGANTGGPPFGVNLLMLTGIVEASKTASSEFAAGIIQAGDGTPALIALPPKIYAVVGREMRTYWYQVQQRNPRSVNISATGLPAGAVSDADGIKWVPTGVITKSVVVSSAVGNNPIDSKTISLISANATTNLGQRVCLFGPGDSLIGNGGMLAALNVIDQADPNISFGYLGTQGGAQKNEGYSGQSLGAFFGPTVGGNPNPFYSGSTFSFASFLADSRITPQLSALGVTEPHWVFPQAGKVDVGQAASDGAALGLAQANMNTLEIVVQSILAATANTKVGIYVAVPGPLPTAEQITYGPLWRVRRTWMILASAQIAQFAGREASRIYLIPVCCAVDPVTGWPRAFQPRATSITRDMVTYATYQAMQADLTKANGVIAFATDVGAYFVKVGGPNVGVWRAATESDGFCFRNTDSIHTANGVIQEAEAIYAAIRAIG